MQESASTTIDNRPGLWRDKTFYGMISTQFLGAFNDNLFKQLVLLLSVDLSLRAAGAQKANEDQYQPLAMAVFSLPFVLLSGYAGYLADRFSKSRIVLLCKIAEIGIMSAGLFALHAENMIGVYLVLFAMGIHSAFFGPAKYGILPELFRGKDLPSANGQVQMTTFLAIIFGTVVCGVMKDAFVGRLWVISGFGIALAVFGTVTATMIRKTPAIRPGLKFEPADLAVNRETWSLFKSDRKLSTVLFVCSVFWMVAGVIPSACNALGKGQFKYNDAKTSVLGGCTGIGIAIGCALAGFLSGGKMSFKPVRFAAWGIVISLGLVALPAIEGFNPPEGRVTMWYVLSCIELFAAGIFTGIFAVPLQVFLQSRPPADQKGRVIGAMNLFNFIGIFLSAAFYWAVNQVFVMTKIPFSGMFLATALMFLPIAIFFKPQDEEFA